MNTERTTVIPNEPPIPKFPDELNCDIVVIGGGPNGLMALAYLAKAGLKVILLEKRYEIGGGLATEEILFPGFYANTHATYHMMVDYIPAISDFDLQKHGLYFIKPNSQTGIVFKDGTSILLSRLIGDSVDSIAKISWEDAEAFEKTMRIYKKMVDEILAPATYYPPLPPGEFSVNLNRTKIGQQLLEISEKNPLDVINSQFKNEKVKALLLYICCMWGLDPQESGLGFMVPLLLNRGLNKCFCIGGSHKFASALAKEIILNKGMILESAEVTKIIIKDEEVKGVELFDGRKVYAKVVVSSLDPVSTFLNMVGEENLPPSLLHYAKNWKWDKWSLFSVHLALPEPPKYQTPDFFLNDAFMNIIGLENIDDVLLLFEGVQKGEIPKIGGHTTCETIYDQTLVRIPNTHTAFFQMPAPYDLKGGWEKKDDLTNKVIEVWTNYAPNLSSNIIAKVCETPLDIERRIACMVKGSIKHGDYNPIQMGYFRPNDLCSSSRTPIKNLYLCGASMYPGGLIIGGPGYIAANVIADDLSIKKWWQMPAQIKKYLKIYIT